MSQLIDIPAAYTAGIIDGEGCIRIIPYLGGITYKVTVEVRMCEVGAIQYIHSYFGGKIALRGSDNEKHRDVWSWLVHGSKACTFLKRIAPHLQVKRRHAEIAIMCGETAEYSHAGYVPEDILAFREKCFQELTRLNVRGVHPPAETNREDLQVGGCDSPNCTDGKGAESHRNVETAPRSERVVL